EARPAHGAEVGVFKALLRKRLVVHGAGSFGVERKLKLAVPVEGVAGAGKLVVAGAGAGAMAGGVGGGGGGLVNDQSLLHVVLVRQAEVLLGGDVAEHGGAVPADHGGADGGGDVVVAGRKVGDQRAEGVERGFVAHLHFLLDLELDLVHGDVAGTFDHDL